ncbi:hypothetical protein E2976_20610 [Paracoccus yeei]|uniref:hypothetical protein n=1 Tax=Paracoccus yeei TaxID=147645 RepID=UPI003BF7CD96
MIEQVRRSITTDEVPTPTDQAVAIHLGISGTSLANWRARETVTPRQMAGLLASAAKASRQRTLAEALRPVVEFFQIRRTNIGSGDTCRIFDVGRGGDEHPYLAGLKRELETRKRFLASTFPSLT